MRAVQLRSGMRWSTQSSTLATQSAHELIATVACRSPPTLHFIMVLSVCVRVHLSDVLFATFCDTQMGILIGGRKSRAYRRNGAIGFRAQVSLHGDAVPVANIGRPATKSVELMSWSSLLGRGSTLDFNFTVLALPKHLAKKGTVQDTWRTCWRILAWSFHALWTGMWPSVDARGRAWPAGSVDAHRANTPLAGGWSATLWTIKGDLEWLWLGLGLEGYGTLTPCPWCRCNCSDVPWTDFRPSALWREQVWTEDAWSAAHPRCIALFNVPGVSILTVRGDLLHAKHLGVDAYFYASVVAYLIYHVMPGSADENLALLWSRIRQVDVARGMREGFANLRLSMVIRQNDFPVLRGKAAEVRNFGVPLLACCHALLQQERPVHRQITLCMERLVRFEEIIDESTGSFCVPAAAAAELEQCTMDFLLVNTLLGHRFHREGILLFHCTIKYHVLMHIALGARDLHPKLAWCYAGEDMMQKLKRIVRSCHVGTGALQVGPTAMVKYTRGLDFRLARCGVV